ncbi:Zn(II)2Cys6 transcription factor domain-containing protein [Aspergillus tanneri]|uniref:Zn(2)-C6 fungal-type domain-containing protein n=1 Tax=Aspergillus tanneri TaxID=1220188 RepID=A0A5M9N5N1_9EURO|nr:uncharacterized protein ATNIH1004_001793 [Aspergillus tanneri]KAA8652884.1 hypothetical protein ATNIH1004_001793 [Aspergillus tanneri]
MRRKACNACVQAKTKCCYTQPTCSRCAKRGILCEYASTANTVTTVPSTYSASSSSTSAPENLARPEETRMSTTDYPSLWSRRSPQSGPGADSLDSWNSQNLFWSLDTFDLPSLPSHVVSEGTRGPTPAISTSLPSLTFPLPSPPSQPPYRTLVEETSVVPPGPGMPDLSCLAGPGSRDAYNSPLASVPSPDGLGGHPSNNVRLLQQYPKLLLQDDFYCPFLHRALFNEHVPDMTILPHTSMAICCGSALEAKDGVGYIKRAMDAQRQSLIESYPTYHCVEQWDALHAMLLYEILEMRVAPVDESESWKRKRRMNGLKSPFLSKMTQCFSRSYLDAHDAALLPSADLNGSWVKWAVTETARRTIFLANIVNFFSNRDLESESQSHYYEPLNDELIMNMPLPCNQALWNARTEDEWLRATQMVQPASPKSFADAPDALSPFGAAAGGGAAACPHIPVGEQVSNQHHQPSLKLLFSKFAKDYLRANFATNAGFSDSDKLRSFIILCALEQFS